MGVACSHTLGQISQKSSREMMVSEQYHTSINSRDINIKIQETLILQRLTEL